MMNKTIIVDSNIFIALFDDRDLHSEKAQQIWKTANDYKSDNLFLDCVANETFSVIGRRLKEKELLIKIKPTFEKIKKLFKPQNMFWSYQLISELYPQIVELLDNYNGEFNFHDALIALTAREEGIEYILSFDKHFDLFPWIKRISAPEQLIEMLQRQ